MIEATHTKALGQIESTLHTINMVLAECTKRGLNIAIHVFNTSEKNSIGNLTQIRAYVDAEGEALETMVPDLMLNVRDLNRRLHSLWSTGYRYDVRAENIGERYGDMVAIVVSVFVNVTRIVEAVPIPKPD